jgi:hypothetical protein
MNEKHILRFKYIDNYGNETNLEQVLPDTLFMDTDQFSLIVEQFKTFLLAVTFPKELVDTITINKKNAR